MKDKILVCGPRPKSEMTGVALAVELLIQGLNKAGVPNSIVDTTFFNCRSKSGAFSAMRAIETICVILGVWARLPFCQVYYATMSTSSFGFIRDYLTVAVAKLLRRRTVLHLHGGGFEDFYVNAKPWLQRLIRANLKRTDVIIVLGELLKDQFYCAGEFVKPKLVVVPNGLTLGVQEPKRLEKALPDDGVMQLLYLSSLMESKGYLDVIGSLKFLNEDGAKKYHLHLCGSFVDAKTEFVRSITNEYELRQYLEAEGLLDQVTVHGQVVGDVKMTLFEQSHLFVLPTNYPWEGQPLSIIEASAYSLPVVSCHHKGIPEQVVDGVNGRLVEKDAESVAAGIMDICASPKTYRYFSEASRRHYEHGFQREVHLEHLLAVISGA